MSGEEKTFGELLAECDVYPEEKAYFINYERVSRMFHNADEPKPVLYELGKEIDKVNQFSEEKVKGFDTEVSRFTEVLDGQRIEEEQAVAGGTGATFWRWFRRNQGGQQPTVRLADVQRLYLNVHEHKKFIRMNTEAVSRLVKKARTKFGTPTPRENEADLEGIPDIPSLPFVRAEQRLNELLCHLEDVMPLEELPKLRMLGEGTAQPGDEKAFASSGGRDSSVSIRTYLYYGVILGIAVPICWWAAHEDTYRMRCLCMLCLILLLNLTQVVPLYCTALSVPFFAMVFRVFPEEDLTKVVGQLLSVMFSSVAIITIVMLTINTIMIKCQVELRFANALTRSGISIHSPVFLLLLMMGTLFMSAFCQSGFLMMGALVPQLRDLPEDKRNTARSVLLGIMMAANSGAALLPLSSPQCLIAVSALKEFNTDISFSSWVLVAFPVTICVCVGLWAIILFFIRLPRVTSDEVVMGNHLYKVPPLTFPQLSMLVLCVALVISMIFSSWVDHYLGGVVTVAFLFLFIVYGSGFCTTNDFNQLNWDCVICIAGANALNHAMRQSGLAKYMASELLTAENIVKDYIWVNAIKITAFVMAVSSFFGQSCTAIIFLPFIMPLAVKLYAPEVVALMAVLGITCSFAFPFSTSDNYVISTTARDDFRRRYLSQMDVTKVGTLGTIFSFVLIITLGYFIGISHFGLPPSHIMKDVPYELRPSVMAYDEGDALQARLKALENRYNELERRDNARKHHSRVHAMSFITWGHTVTASDISVVAHHASRDHQQVEQRKDRLAARHVRAAPAPSLRTQRLRDTLPQDRHEATRRFGDTPPRHERKKSNGW